MHMRLLSVTFVHYSFVSDEVDILGYGSSTSDTDDHSSVGSNSSDGGCAVSTRRLHLDSLGSL